MLTGVVQNVLSSQAITDMALRRFGKSHGAQAGVCKPAAALRVPACPRDVCGRVVAREGCGGLQKWEWF